VQPIDFPAEALRPLKRAEYDQLVELGVFDGEKLELLYGRLVEMSPTGEHHAYVVRKLNMLLTPALVGRAEVGVQGPVAASDESEPEPDIAVLPPGDYLDDHAKSALLIVEVADSSRHRDLTVKARLYAEMGVGDYWVVDLTRREVVVHRRPAGDRFGDVSTFDASAEVALLSFPDVIVRIAAILPPA
jgi:Uma2 family endonuclease